MLAACSFWALGASPAHAWDASVDAQGTLTIDGGAADNAISVAPGPAGIQISDQFDLFAGAVPGGCTLSPDELLSCPVPTGGVVVHAGGGDDQVTVSTAEGVTATGDAGFDVLSGGAGGDVLSGGADDDLLQGRDGADVLSGDAGQDELDGGAGADRLDGGDDADRLDGGIDADVLQGGAGDDESAGNDGADAIVDTAGDDTLDGGAGDDRLDGGVGNDELSGGRGVNSVSGGDDEDEIVLSGEAGDAGDGGAGDDTLLATDAVGAVSLSGGDGQDDLESGPGSDALTGGDGADSISGGEGDDTVTGGAGDDTLDPGSGPNTTHGDGGNDSVNLSGAAGETAFGDDGNDTITAGASGAQLSGGAGDDELLGDDGPETLDGGTGSDTLIGAGGDDKLDGGDGDDQLSGGLGADDLHGGIGADTVSYDDAADGVQVTLNDLPEDGAFGEHDNVHSDVETVIGSAGDDTLVAGGQPASLIGGAGADRLFGSAGPDRLDGGFDDDLLQGRKGDDAISGGDGSDTISYEDRLNSVTIALNDAGPVSGESGEHDALSTVENAATGSGPDRVIGQAGVVNRIETNEGDDTIDVADRDSVVDVVVCGDGNDRANVDRQDSWDGESCEGVTASGVLQAPHLDFKGPRVLHVRRHGLVRVALHCKAVTVRWCSGVIDLHAQHGRRLSIHRRFRIVSGLHRHLLVRIRRRTRRELEHKSRIAAIGVIRVRDALNRVATVRFTARLAGRRR